MNGIYTLKYRKPIPCNDLRKWSKWCFRYGIKNRRIRCTQLANLTIHTSFLGIDYSWMDNNPFLYETMIYDKNEIAWLQFQTRCDTHRNALKMHRNAVLFAKGYVKGCERRLRLASLDGIKVNG